MEIRKILNIQGRMEIRKILNIQGTVLDSIQDCDNWWLAMNGLREILYHSFMVGCYAANHATQPDFLTTGQAGHSELVEESATRLYRQRVG